MWIGSAAWTLTVPIISLSGESVLNNKAELCNFCDAIITEQNRKKVLKLVEPMLLCVFGMLKQSNDMIVPQIQNA